MDSIMIGNCGWRSRCPWTTWAAHGSRCFRGSCTGRWLNGTSCRATFCRCLHATRTTTLRFAPSPLSHTYVFPCVCINMHALIYWHTCAKWSDLIHEIHSYTCTCMHTTSNYRGLNAGTIREHGCDVSDDAASASAQDRAR